MNNNSNICNFISANPNTWEELLSKEYNIKVKREGPLAIFNYGFAADFSLPLVQEARGIIINTSTLEVVCLPFRKFGNYNESYADAIDWDSAVVQEKVDGSIVKLWFNTLTDAWQFSTNGTIDAGRATVGEIGLLKFDDIIKEAVNYNDIPFDTLDKSKTYIFELVSPKAQIIIKYPETKLYHSEHATILPLRNSMMILEL